MSDYRDFYENKEEEIQFSSEHTSKEKRNWKKALRFAAGSAAFGMVFGFGLLTYTREGAGIEKQPVRTEVVQMVPEKEGGEAGSDVMDADPLASIGKTNPNSATSTVIDVSNIVDAALPSVVAVNCVTYVQERNIFTYGFYNSGNSGRILEQDSCGTGIIIGESDENLMILTNNHVIENTNKVSVVFSDGMEVEGSVLGSDVDADIAIVLIPIANIPEQTRSVIKIAALGDSEGVRVGSAAIAIGNALGYGQSVTTGVISAVNREVKLTDKTMTLIQTDAAINNGNSGGPLLNSNGEVIGINTVKYAASGVEGMGYAIPITNAKPIIESIINGNNTTQNQDGVLFGIYGEDVTEQLQRMFQMPAGVYVSGVVENSPAEKYQIQAGSIITAVDGRAITGMEDLTAILAEHQAGDTITVTMVVPGREQATEQTVQVVLAARGDSV